MMTKFPSPPAATLVGLGLQVMLAIVAAYGLWVVPSLGDRWGWSLGGLALAGLWAVLVWGARPLLRRWPTRREWIGLAVILIAVRMASGWLALGRVSSGDPDIYVSIARELLSGQGYFVDDPDMGIRAYAFFPPAYPVLLTGWGALFGLSTWSLLVLGSTADLVAATLIWRIGCRVGNAGAGRAAALRYLFWPSVLFSDGLAQKEGMSTALVLGLALVWLKRADGELAGWRGALALGIPAGVLALTQPGQTALSALFGLVLIGRIGIARVIGFGLRAMPVAAMVLLPWWLRNALVFGAFVPLTSAGGLSLWIGNSAEATGNWIQPPRQLKGLPELVYGKQAALLARDWIMAHPGNFILLTITKFVRAMGVGEFGLFRLAIMDPPISAFMTALLFPVSQLAHVALLGASSIALRWRARPDVALLTLLLLAGFVQLCLFGVWFEFGERHREFMTPFMLLLICAALNPPGPRQSG
jgi:hypothetical protein